jgi:hypothetical protein
MNLELYEKLMAEGCPGQQPSEWLMFLEVCETYLKKNKIKNPIVVELGTWKNNQKKFYEQLLGAKHISIDISVRRSAPDIKGDTHDPETLEALKKKLGGKSINILFIDAHHAYESVKKDFEMYSPLCTNIVVFHDIELRRHENSDKGMVWKFWDELKKMAFTELMGYERYIFLSICRRSFKRPKIGCMGIGMMIKK